MTQTIDSAMVRHLYFQGEGPAFGCGAENKVCSVGFQTCTSPGQVCRSSHILRGSKRLKRKERKSKGLGQNVWLCVRYTSIYHSRSSLLRSHYIFYQKLKKKKYHCMYSWNPHGGDWFVNIILLTPKEQNATRPTTHQLCRYKELVSVCLRNIINYVLLQNTCRLCEEDLDRY